MAFLPLAISAGASLLQFSGKKSASEIELLESESTAKQIELGATQREGDRMNNLARAMASQTASAGARGISAFEGSPLSILNADIEAAELAQERDTFQSDLASMTTRVGGRVRKQLQDTSAQVGLISDFAKIAQSA